MLYRLWGSHRLRLLGGGRKPPPPRRLPEHPQASSCLCPPLPGASSPEQLPSPGPAVPLKELESELRMLVTQGGRGGHLHWPVARTAARKEAEQPQLPVCVPLRGAETTEPRLRLHHVGTCVMKLPLTMRAFRVYPRQQGWGLFLRPADGDVIFR